MTGEDKFLSRWSRRKQEARLTDAEPDAEEVIEVVEDAAEEPEKTDAEILAELGLKDPDEMGAGDDFSVFMKTAIPERLRNRALRKLWRSNPVLANLDALVEYGEDYTDAATVVENLVTAYKVGRGFVDKLVVDDGEQEKAPDSPEAVAAVADEPKLGSVREPDEDEPVPIAQPAEPVEPEPPEIPPRRQRMAFRF